MHFGYWLVIMLLAIGCEKDTKTKQFFSLPDQQDSSVLEILPKQAECPLYPWQDGQNSSLRTITKDYFRCQGSSQNPPRIVMEGTKEIQRYYDCSGGERHSLPLYDGKEHIYPILIELLNEIQRKTNKAVIITSGHRCPAHQAYIDATPKAMGSKHQIGAQVTFYVQGLETNPERALQIILDYYKSHESYAGKKEYTAFTRYEKQSDVSTVPWYNKELFIKIYKANEGRDFDNRHPYPYICLQVRHDRQKNEAVLVTYAKANQLLRK